MVHALRRGVDRGQRRVPVLRLPEVIVPPCAYCGAPLEHKRSAEGEAMWVIFYVAIDHGETREVCTVKWSMFPPRAAGRVVADGFICTQRCTGKPIPRDYFKDVS